jgi:hypothetical protein
MCLSGSGLLVQRSRHSRSAVNCEAGAADNPFAIAGCLSANPVGALSSRRVAYWHKCEVPTELSKVRFRRQSGRHLLTLSSSQFDPEPTWGAEDFCGEPVGCRQRPIRSGPSAEAEDARCDASSDRSSRGGPPYRSTMEVAMRIAIMTAVAPLLLITGVTLSAPAAATDAKQAMSMCDARGDACRMNVDNYGNVTLLVQNSGGTGVQGSSR